MTREQAIKRLNGIITTKFINDYSIDSTDKEAIETVLSMLKEKDKIIDLMAEKIAFNYDINSYEDIKTLKKQIKQKYEGKREE